MLFLPRWSIVPVTGIVDKQGLALNHGAKTSLDKQQ